MKKYEKNILPYIESIYSTFTPLEKTIADFFLNNHEKMDFSSRHISALLYVSEPSLSRFAKKCGYQGYREFLFYYQRSLEAQSSEPVLTDNSAKIVLTTYQELLNKSYSLVDERQMERLCLIISEKKRIFVYGRGSSGLAAQEMQFRLMRIGIPIQCITDTDLIRMNSVLLDEQCAVIGISVSGRTNAILDSLKTAREIGAATILFTAYKQKDFPRFCDEIILCAVKENLDNGKAISPQFPVLVMIDLFYAHLLKYDTIHREALHDYTLKVLSAKEPPTQQ